MSEHSDGAAPAGGRVPRVAILSGKGGVGKTNLALNLALALGDMGLRALLVDGDLGLANLDVLLGVTPERTLTDVLDGAAGIEDALVPVEEGVDLLPSGSGTPGPRDLDGERARALDEALALDGARDIVLMDLGAGLSEDLARMALLADFLLVVTTPEPTALTDAYALMKVLHARHGLDEFWVAVNMVVEEGEAGLVEERLVGACEHFLGFSPLVLGAVRADPALPAAVCRQRPLLRAFPESAAAGDIRALARELAARVERGGLGSGRWRPRE